jgi:hypothetical protein
VDAVHVNPLAALLPLYQADYERVLDPRLSLVVGGFFAHLSSDNGVTVSALGLTVQPHCYPFGRAPGGLYLAPFLSAGYVGLVDGGARTSADVFGYEAGAPVGYSFTWDPVNIKLGVGAKYVDMSLRKIDDSGMGRWFGASWPAMRASSRAFARRRRRPLGSRTPTSSTSSTSGRSRTARSTWCRSS